MGLRENNYNKKESESIIESESQKRQIKPLLSFYLKRVVHYLSVLQAVMTICLLIFYSQNVITLEIINFYLYFSVIVFITYGSLILGIQFLEKPQIEKIPAKPIEPLEEIEELKPEITEDLLQGKTLQVYWFFFTRRHAGIREIQKALDISSSGTVSYQITKLLKAGIISKDDEEGKYSLKEVVKIGILKFFIRIGNRTIPRISLYLIIFSFGFVIYLILALLQGINFLFDPINLLLLFFLILVTLIFVLESYKIWKLKPIKTLKKNSNKRK
ncbi:MAG: hypothetical protein ACFFB9_13220 [Promethearchaeota archaeon]